MAEIWEEKAALREKLREARFNLDSAERTLKSRIICQRLKDLLDWSKVRSVHYFEPMRHLQEVDLGDFVVWLEDNCLNTQLFTPKLIGTQWQMVSIKDKPAPGQFDVIIVPMLGFDETLNRIGYGGGYYDAFLATQPKAKKIGVCFEIGKVKKIPTVGHDLPVDKIVTEDRVYHS
jgi:5-formyltetrahydrofolate cyclo-ligase